MSRDNDISINKIHYCHYFCNCFSFFSLFSSLFFIILLLKCAVCRRIDPPTANISSVDWRSMVPCDIYSCRIPKKAVFINRRFLPVLPIIKFWLLFYFLSLFQHTDTDYHTVTELKNGCLFVAQMQVAAQLPKQDRPPLVQHHWLPMCPTNTFMCNTIPTHTFVCMPVCQECDTMFMYLM